MSRRTFIISDTHFFHTNIIEYESRPFSNTAQMNSAMINRWNQVVSKGDIVIHLGDVCFSNKKTTQAILSQLNGYKRLVMGNHDRRKTRSWWLDAGFDEVSEEPILYKGFYIMSHEPVYINSHMPYVNVHGHIHGAKYEGSQYINLCVEHWNYTPVNFEEIEKIAIKSGELEEA